MVKIRQGLAGITVIKFLFILESEYREECIGKCLPIIHRKIIPETWHFHKILSTTLVGVSEYDVNIFFDRKCILVGTIKSQFLIFLV